MNWIVDAGKCIKNKTPSISFLIVAGIAAVVVLSLGFVFYSDVEEKSLGFDDLCFTSACLKDFSEDFDGLLALAEFWSKFLSLVFVSWGGLIALSSYRIASKSSALIGYVEHIRLFRDYVSGEIDRLDHVNATRINTNYWYHVAFPESKLGNVEISKRYLGFVREISDAIEITNNSIGRPKGEFGYAKHQGRMITAFENIGIFMERLPKNDFLKAEEKLLLLVDSINYAFDPGHDRDQDLSRIVRRYA